jgi:ABC-2 type transport system permease protein
MSSARSGRSGGTAKVLAIAWREFRHTVLTKGFLVGAIVVPIVMFGVISAIGLLMGDKIRPTEGTLAVLDPTGTVAPFVEEELSPARMRERGERAVGQAANALPGAPKDMLAQAGELASRVNVRVEAVEDQSREAALREQVTDGTLLGLAIVPAGALTTPPARGPDDAGFSLIVPNNSPPRTTGLLESAVATAIVKARVQASGGDYAALQALLSRPDPAVRRMGADGVEKAESTTARMLVPMGFMMLLWIATFTSGNYLLTSTIEEKGSKVMEVLLSAVSPMQLLLGKIIGYSLVSVVMLVSYGALALTGLAAASMADLISPMQLVLLVVFFVMAYLFVATIMVSVGSAVSDLREAQSLIGPAMIVLMIPLMLWLPISDNPNGVVATVFSFIPPAIPYVMILRTTGSSEAVPAWQVALSIAWGFACVVGFLWSGAKIFRVGVLMQGKPPTPRELLRWIRSA